MLIIRTHSLQFYVQIIPIFRNNYNNIMSDQQRDKKNQEYYTQSRKLTKLETKDKRFLNEDEIKQKNTMIKKLNQKLMAQQLQRQEPLITSLYKKDQMKDKQIQQRQDELGLKLKSSNLFQMLAYREQEIKPQIQQNKPDSRIEGTKKQFQQQQSQNCWFSIPMLINQSQQFIGLSCQQQILTQFKYKMQYNQKENSQKVQELANSQQKLQKQILQQQKLLQKLQLQLSQLSSQSQLSKPQQMPQIQQRFSKCQKDELLKIIQKNQKQKEILKLKNQKQKEILKLKNQKQTLKYIKEKKSSELKSMKEKLINFVKLIYNSSSYNKRQKFEPYKNMIKFLQKTCLRKTSFQKFKQQFEFQELMNPTKERFQQLRKNLSDKQKVSDLFYQNYQKEILDFVQGGFLIKMDKKYFDLMSTLIREGFTERFKDAFQSNTLVKRPQYQARHFCQLMIRESQIMKNSIYSEAAKTVIKQTLNSKIIRELMKDYLTIYKSQQQKKQTVEITIENIKLFLEKASYQFFDYGFPKMQGITTNNSPDTLGIFFNTFAFQNNKYNQEFFKGYIFYVFLHQSLHYLVRKFGLVENEKSIKNSWSKNKLHLNSKNSKKSLNQEGGQMFEVYLFGKKVQKLFQSDYKDYQEVLNKFSHQKFNEKSIQNARQQFIEIQKLKKQKKGQNYFNLQRNTDDEDCFQFDKNWCLTSFKNMKLPKDFAKLPKDFAKLN